MSSSSLKCWSLLFLDHCGCRLLPMKKLLGNYRDRFFDCINNTSINLYEKIRNYTIRTKKVTVQVRRMLQFWILNFMKVKLEKKKDPNPVSITARNAHNNRNSVFQAKWRFKLKEKKYGCISLWTNEGFN
jgi:hypothetical protein